MYGPDYPFIDLREELKELMKTTYNWYGLRQPDYSKKCGCSVLNKDGVSTPSINCKRCLSTGYVFTDYLIKAYSWLGVLGFEFPTGPGLISTKSKQIVIQSDRVINKFDIILELDQEKDGPSIKTPFKILKAYIIQDCDPMRLDNARIEYWRCNLEERNISDYRAGEEGTGYTYKGNRSANDPV